MRTRPILHVLMAFAATSMVFACGDDTKIVEPGDDEAGDGDGDQGTETGDGDGAPGDGDGAPGDGDGAPGDGDGAPGDGDGAPGDGDGDAASECETYADVLAPEVAIAEGGCSIVIRFDYETVEPKAWSSYCGELSDDELDEDAARKQSDCCSDGERLNPGEDDLFILYSEPDPLGGVAVVSDHFAAPAFEATISGEEDPGEIKYPDAWAEANLLGSGCPSELPMTVGVDLAVEGAELTQENIDQVLQAFADTALTEAIEQNSNIRRTVTMLYPAAVDPFKPEAAEYVLIIETGGE